MSDSDVNIKNDLRKAKEYYRSKKYEDAEEIFSRHYQTSPDEFSRMDRDFYAWSIYRTKLNDSQDRETLEKAGELIAELTQQKDLSKKDNACPYTLSMFKLIDIFSKDKSHADVIYWCEELDPKLLSTEKFVSFNDNIFPSKREKWYNELTKALLKNEQFDDCIKYSKEALIEIPEFTNENETWMKYRIAKSYKEIGDYDDSIELLKEIIKVKNDWFIQNEIAENYYFKGDFDSTLKYAVEAALNGKQEEMKVNLYSLIQELLEKKGETEAAAKHAYLIYSIRLNKEWGIDESLEEIVIDNGFDPDNTKYWEIESELRDYWAEIQYKDQQLNYGTVEKIFPHGKSGFIMADDNKSYFFNMSEYMGDRNTISIGDFVTFYLKEGFDRKKNQETLNAVYIQPGF